VKDGGALLQLFEAGRLMSFSTICTNC